MAIADTITSMQNHTSNAYTMIGYGTDLTGINKNLENLSSTIFEAFLEALRTPDTLFTNLPKKSGTGANITLNDTANAPMRIMLNATDITQDGTPSPSSPQDIHTISGDNTLVVNSTNLLDTSKIVKGRLDNGVIGYESNTTALSNTDTSFSFTTNTGWRGATTDFIKRKNGDFVLIAGTTDNNNINPIIAFYDKNKNYITTKTCANQTYGWRGGNTGNDISDAEYIRIYFALSSAGSVTVTQPLVQFGTTPTSYEPYVSQEANIDLKSSNMFDRDGLTFKNLYYLDASTGAETYNSLFKYTMSYIQVKPSTNYMFSGFGSGTKIVYYYDASKTFLSSTGTWGTTEKTFTTPNNCEYIRISLPLAENMSSVMLNEGSTALPYETYYDYGEYCKIGTYEDKFIRTSGKNLFDSSLFDTFTTSIQTISLTLKPNTIYTMSTNLPVTSGSVNLFFKLPSESYSGATNGVSPTTSRTLTTDSTGIVNIGYRNYNSGISGNPKTDYWYMLNEGTTALPYEPYGSNEWYIKKNIGKVVLDGSETWNLASNRGNADAGYTIFGSSLLYSLLLTNGGFLCNRFPYLKYDGTGGFRSGSGNVEAISDGGGYRFIYIRIEDSRLNSVDAEGLKTWLSANNTTIYYVLSTPTYTQITGTLAEQLEYVYQLLKSYKGVTNISQVNNDLAFELDVEAVEELI